MHFFLIFILALSITVLFFAAKKTTVILLVLHIKVINHYKIKLPFSRYVIKTFVYRKVMINKFEEILLTYYSLITSQLFVLFMKERHAVSVQELYSTANKLNELGIEGYRVHPNYFDPAKQIEQRQFLKGRKPAKDRRYKTKKGSFIEDEQKIHKSVPGPGHYPIASVWPQTPKLKVRYTDKKTYIDEIIKRVKKQKRPAPGHYHTFKSLKQMDAQRKLLAVKKLHYQDKFNIFDDFQFRSTQFPGAGSYNPHDRIKTEYSKTKTKPQDWRKKHEQLSKKKPLKSPTVATYNPLPLDSTLFQHFQKQKKVKSSVGKGQRFKTAPSGSGLPPAKYSVIQEWRGKQKKKLERHGIEALSRTTYKSVYYH